MPESRHASALRRIAAVIADELSAWARHDETGDDDRPAATEHPAPAENVQLSAEQVEQVIGTAMMRLLLNWDWVHRRVELVRFVDADTVHRQMSVDFTLPDDRHTVGLRVLRPGVVPLAMLKKRALSRFSLWDEDGRRLAMFTTEQNGAYAAAALVALVRVAAVETHQPIGDVPAEVMEVFRRVAHARTAEARVLLACLQDGVGAHEDNLDELGKHVPPAVDSPISELSNRQLAERLHPHATLTSTLMRSVGLKHMAEQLAGQFVVLTELPSDGDKRRIVKFSYEEPPSSYRPTRLPLALRAVRPVRAVLVALSWWHKTITLDSVPVGTARSYHIELEAPEDVEFIGARLTAEDPGRDDDEPRRVRSTTTERQRVHLQVSGAPPAVTGPVWVQVRAVRAGFLRSALVLSALVAALLAVGEERLPVITSKAEAAAALLLAIPTLLAAFLIRPGEHEMVSRMLVGVRALLVGSAACTLVAAALISGGYGLDTATHVWNLGKWVAAGLAGAMLASYALPYVTPRLSRATSWVYDQWRRLRRKFMRKSKKSDTGPILPSS